MAAELSDTLDELTPHDFSPRLLKENLLGREDGCELRIVIDKRKGGSMGINIDFDDGVTLLIEAIQEGLVHAWNMRNPWLVVKPGYRIVQVNGFEGNAADLIHELRKDDVLIITIRCQPDAPGCGQSCTTTDHTDNEVRSAPSPGSSDSGTNVQEHSGDEAGASSPEQQGQSPRKPSTGGFHNTTSWQKGNDDERLCSPEDERRSLRQLSPSSSRQPSPGGSSDRKSWQMDSDDETWFLRRHHYHRESQRQRYNLQKDRARSPAHECYTSQHSSLPAQPGQGADSQSLVTFVIYAVPVPAQAQPPSSTAAGPAPVHHGAHLADQVHRAEQAGRKRGTGAEAPPHRGARGGPRAGSRRGARGAEAAPGPAPTQGARGAPTCVHREPAGSKLLWPGAPRWPPISWPSRPWVVPCSAATGVPFDREIAGVPITTLTINNLPIELTQDELLDLLDTSGFKGCYDYVYLPGDDRKEDNLGHAFVNLRTPEDAQRLFAAWHGGRMQGFCAVAPVLRISVSRTQGLRANSRQWTASRLRCVPPSLHPFLARRARDLRWETRDVQ